MMMNILNTTCRRSSVNVLVKSRLLFAGVGTAAAAAPPQIRRRNRSIASAKSKTLSAEEHARIDGKPEPEKRDTGKVNLEEIAQLATRRRRSKEEFKIPGTGPPEPESQREYRLNSHFYRHLYPWKSKEQLAAYLCHQIVHESDGVIAINKPFGVGARNVHQAKEDDLEILRRSGKQVHRMDAENDPMHHARGIGVCEYTLEDVLPILRSKLGEPDLQLVKSIDKFCSGIAIFGTTEKAVERIQKSIKLNKPLGVKAFSFLVISMNNSKKFQEVGTLTERVAITLAENPETRVAHPIILREFSKKRAREVQSNIKPVTVALTLLDKNAILNVCLSRFDTNSTNNNFLRVYYANIVSPILGDHLYGTRVATVGGVMVPVPPAMARVGVGHQILSREVISALRLRRPEDSIVVPLHSHLETFTLGNFCGKGQHLYLSAPPFPLFSWTCKQLSLKLPIDSSHKNEND